MAICTWWIYRAWRTPGSCTSSFPKSCQCPIDKLGRFEPARVRFHVPPELAPEADQQISKLLGPAGYLVSIPSANQLVIGDTGDNLRAISRTIDAMLVSSRNTAEIEPTEFAIQDELEKDPGYYSLEQRILEYQIELAQLRNHYGADSPQVNQIANLREILVKEQKERADDLRPRIIERLKSGRSGTKPIENQVPTAETSQIAVFSLVNAKAETLLPKVKEVVEPLAEVNIVADARTNSIVVTAPPKAIELVQAILLKLDSMDSAPLSTDATYNGRTYSEWLQITRTEQSESGLADAIEAMFHLTTDANQPELIKSVRIAVRKYGRNTRIRGRGSVYPVTSRAIQALETLEAKLVAEFVLTEAKEGTRESRDFLFAFLDEQGRSASVWNGLAPRCQELIQVLRNNFHMSEDDHEKSTAAKCICELCIHVDSHDVQAVEGLAEFLVERYREWNLLKGLAAEALACVDPGNRLLVEDWLSEGFSFGSREMRIVSRMGPHAAPVVPAIIQHLKRSIRIGTPPNQPGNRIWLQSDRFSSLVVEALGNIGPAAQDALPLLESYVADDIELHPSNVPGSIGDIRLYAQDAIKKIENGTPAK